jgi:predicted PurR-regulated permease PerM
MLLWDWPNITRGVESLKDSRLQGFYHEVAPSTKVFAQLFGKALQAQTRIAVVNTALTFAGMWLLGIPGLLLSLFVFMCRHCTLSWQESEKIVPVPCLRTFLNS